MLSCSNVRTDVAQVRKRVDLARCSSGSCYWPQPCAAVEGLEYPVYYVSRGKLTMPHLDRITQVPRGKAVYSRPEGVRWHHRRAPGFWPRPRRNTQGMAVYGEGGHPGCSCLRGAAVRGD